ncbi:hypothetical protein ACSQ67_008866 [Phaseolus vulgaris]
MTASHRNPALHIRSNSLRLLVSRTPPLKPLVDFRFPNPPISQSEEKQLKGERTSIYESTVFRLGALSSKVMEDARKPLKTGNLLCKVVDLAAGEARNLILTDATHSRGWKLQRHRIPSSTRFQHATVMDLFRGQAMQGRVQKKMRETGEWVAANAEAKITSSSTFSFHQLQSHF